MLLSFLHNRRSLISLTSRAPLNSKFLTEIGRFRVLLLWFNLPVDESALLPRGKRAFKRILGGSCTFSRGLCRSCYKSRSNEPISWHFAVPPANFCLSFPRMPSLIISRSTRERFQLQARGYEVVIAHPERYRAIQTDIGLARELTRMGCKPQVSSDFVAGGQAELGTQAGQAPV